MRESRRAAILGMGVSLVLSLAARAGGDAPAGVVQAPSVRPSTSDANPLVQLLQAAFAARNPAVTHARVLELRSTGSWDGPYVLLGWGIRPDRRFEGRFDDELFGEFIVNEGLTRVERTLDVFPTRRWADYIVSIER